MTGSAASSAPAVPRSAPTKCLAMDTQYSAALTTHTGLYKVTVAGPKKKEPAAGAVEKKEE
ncbi:hypothetical protein [Methanoregula sp.]|uniref:hypothetical protein n=1 Tax=Methanoregula sp. TaxID=2052170 RepID=UPI003BAFE354